MLGESLVGSNKGSSQSWLIARPTRCSRVKMWGLRCWQSDQADITTSHSSLLLHQILPTFRSQQARWPLAGQVSLCHIILESLNILNPLNGGAHLARSKSICLVSLNPSLRKNSWAMGSEQATADGWTLSHRRKRFLLRMSLPRVCATEEVVFCVTKAVHLHFLVELSHCI